MTYEENVRLYKQKIEDCEREKETAGTVHKKDLDRQLKRLKKELSEYKMHFKKYFQNKKKNT